MLDLSTQIDKTISAIRILITIVAIALIVTGSTFSGLLVLLWLIFATTSDYFSLIFLKYKKLILSDIFYAASYLLNAGLYIYLVRCLL